MKFFYHGIEKRANRLVLINGLKPANYEEGGLIHYHQRRRKVCRELKQGKRVDEQPCPVEAGGNDWYEVDG